MLLGLSIFLALSVSSVLVTLLSKMDLESSLGMIVGSVLILILGLIDDIKKLSVFTKLTGQIVVSVIAVNLGVVSTIASIPAWFNMLITVIWIIALVNAFNLLDIMDGLCIGISLIIAAFFLHISFIIGDQQTASLFWMLSGALMAAFIYNRPPAKLYLGDSGSMLLGFLFSCSALNISYAPEHVNKLVLLVPVLMVGLPLYDLSLTMFMRAKKSIPVMHKSKDHPVFIMSNLGFSTKKILTIMYITTGCFGFCALALLTMRSTWKASLLVGIVTCLLILTLVISRAEARQK